MTSTMPADRKQVEEAVERLYEGWEMACEAAMVDCDDLRLLLTDHAALLARAEAAEAALKCLGRSKAREPAYYRGFALNALRAAHQPPAPVKADGEG